MKKLDKRKELAAKVLGVGKGRIRFDNSRLSDIKEAITKQDIRDLYQEGIINIKDVSGRRKKKKRKTRLKAGKIRKKLRRRKKVYVRMVRKQRAYIRELKKQGRLAADKVAELRKKAKAREFEDKSHLREYIQEMEAKKK